MSRSTWINLTIGAVILLVLATPFLIPLNMYRGQIEAAASRALAREVHIKGPLHLTVYPFGLSVSDITVANVEGAHDPQMITADELVVGAEVMPLFSGRLQVTGLTLERPVIHLEVAKSGTPNWSFSKEPNSKQPADAAALDRIGFSHLDVKDGSVTYYDAGTGKTAALTAVSLSLNMPEVSRPTLKLPLTMRGELTYNNEKLKIDGRFDSLGNLMSAKTTGGRIAIGSNVINTEFTGQFGGDGSLSGALKLGAHSVRSLAAWLGSPMPAGNGFGLMALEGQFSARDGVYSLRQTHLAFDGMNLNGDLAFDTNPKVLTLNGHLAIDRIDTRPYLAPGAEADTTKAAKAKAANPGAPLSLDGLKAVNANLNLQVGELVLPQLTLNQAIVTASLENGVLIAGMSKVNVYGGNGSATLTVDAGSAIPSFKSTLNVKDIKVQPFLVQLTGVKNITGKGAVRYDLVSRGSTTADIIKGLAGKGEVRFTDGEIEGADLVAISRVVQSMVTLEALSTALGNEAKTPFGRMGATFAIDKGMLHTNDFALVNPTVEMTGQGDVDFSAETLEFHFVPKAVKGIPGLKLVDIGVPFYLKGPWAKPGYGPDARALAKTIVQKLEDGVTSPLDLIKNPGLSLKSIFGTQKPATK